MYKYFLIFTALLNQSLFAQKCNTLIPYRSGKLWGYSDYEGKIIIKPEYDKVDFFYYNNSAAVYKNCHANKTIVTRIDTLGIKIVPLKYLKVDWVALNTIQYIFSNKYEELKNNGRLIDTTEDLFGIAFRDKIVNKNLYFIQDSSTSKFGLYDSQLKKEVVKCNFDYIEYIYHKDGKYFFKIEKNSLYGIIDENGKVIEKCVNGAIFIEQNQINGNYDSIVVIEKIPSEGEQEIPPSEGMSGDSPIMPSIKSYTKEWNNIKGKYGITSDTGIIIPFVYDVIKSYEKTNLENLYVAQKDKKWGVIKQENGEIVIPFLYDGIGESVFDNKKSKTYIVSVKRDNLWGVVDENNKTIAPFIFSDALLIDPYLKENNLVIISKSYNQPFLYGDNWIGIYFINTPEKSIYDLDLGKRRETIYYKCQKKEDVIFYVNTTDDVISYYLNSNGFKYYDDK